MQLLDVCSKFPELGLPHLQEKAHPEHAMIVALRSTVREALANDEFLVDCIARDLTVLEEHGRRSAALTPFFTDPVFGVRFAFGFWPPKYSMEAHEHTAWTITAVCHNRLSVATFDRVESYRRRELVPKNLFDAARREVGYIYGPAIHAPRNTSDRWSLTLHISSPRDGEPASDFEPLPVLAPPTRLGERQQHDRHPSMWVFRARIRRNEADLLARILLSSGLPSARDLLVRCLRLTSSAMRAAVRSALSEDRGHPASPRQLTRVHPDVCFRLRQDDDEWSLDVETPRGFGELVRVNDAAHDALAFAATRLTFDTQELPGHLSDIEREAIADLLEDVGLFDGAAR
jgi:hypothetical protein